MTGTPPDDTTSSSSRRVGLFLVTSLILVLAFFPPETRGESLAGCAALAAILALWAWRAPPPAVGSAALAVLLAVALPLAWGAMAPGHAVQPLATAFVAVALGVHAAGLRGSARALRVALLALAAAGGWLGAYAAVQKLWGLEAAAAWAETAASLADRDLVLARLREGRAFAAFATPAALGGYLAVAIPVTLGLAHSSRGRARVALYAAGAAQAAGLLCTASATAAGALLGAVLLALALRPGRRRALAAAALLAAVVLAGVALARGKTVLDPLRAGGPWQLRAGNYRIALAMIGDHPWLGVGPGGFGERFSAYRLPGDNEARHAHSLPLEAAAELGVPAGAIVTVVFFGVFLAPLARGRTRGDPRRLGAAVGLAAFALHNLADFTAFYPSLAMTCALCRGLLVEPGRADDAPASRTLRVATLGGTLAACALAGLSGLAWNERFEARSRAAAGDLEAATASARRAVALAPWHPDAHLFLARALLEGAGAEGRALEDARMHADRAVAGSPIRAGARWTRARVRLAAGDAAGAYADLSEAARLYPLRAEYARERERLEEALATAYGGGPGA